MLDFIRTFSMGCSIAALIISFYNLYNIIRRWEYYHDFGSKIVVDEKTNETICIFWDADNSFVKKGYKVIDCNQKKLKFAIKNGVYFYKEGKEDAEDKKVSF